MTPATPTPFLSRAIRAVALVNVAWGLVAAGAGNWGMVGLQAAAAVALMGVSFLVRPPRTASSDTRGALGRTLPPAPPAAPKPFLDGQAEANHNLEPDAPDPEEASLLEWLEHASAADLTATELSGQLASGAAIDEIDDNGWSAFELAVAADAPPEFLTALVAAGANPHRLPDLMEHALDAGASPAVVRALLDLGVSPTITPANYDSLVEMAIEEEADEEVVQLLLAAGAPTSTSTADGEGLLSLAIQKSYPANVLLALAGPLPAQPAPSPQLDEGLFVALGEIYEDTLAPLVAQLVARGANPFRVPDGEDQAPVAVMVENGELKCLERLADVLAPDQRLRLMGWVEALDGPLAQRLAPRLALVQDLEQAWRAGYANGPLNRHGHEDHCNLMFPATMGTDQDRCDCAAATGQRPALPTKLPPDAVAVLSGQLAQARDERDVQRLLLAGADPLAPLPDDPTSTVLQAARKTASPFVLAMLLEPVVAAEPTIKLDLDADLAQALEHELRLRQVLRARCLG